MNNVAQKPKKRPSEIPPAPPSRPRRKKGQLLASIASVHPIEPHDAESERRIAVQRAAREVELDAERAAFAQDLRDYTVIANEVEGGPLRVQSMSVVLATAIGSHPGDPLTAILEEIEQRCGTLALVARGAAKSDLGDVIESLEQELAMLRTRASVAVEIVRRVGPSTDAPEAVESAL